MSSAGLQNRTSDGEGSTSAPRKACRTRHGNNLGYKIRATYAAPLGLLQGRRACLISLISISGPTLAMPGEQATPKGTQVLLATLFTKTACKQLISLQLHSRFAAATPGCHCSREFCSFPARPPTSVFNQRHNADLLPLCSVVGSDKLLQPKHSVRCTNVVYAGFAGLPLPSVVHAQLEPGALRNGRAIIVGDVHGCPAELDDLLTK